MSEQDRYMPGVPCWVDTTQPDPAAAGRFYSGLFGWELQEDMPADVPGSYLAAMIDGEDVAAISSVPEGAPPRAVWNTYVWVTSADATAATVREAGGRVLSEPFDVFDAGRMAVCADREGAVFSVWEARRHRGAQRVNEHGSVNFNDLHTRDVEAARAFYGAVFGWRVLEVGDGFAAWALPGYGDFLERRTPGTLAMQAELGAPEGFADVVASLAPIEDDQTPPHWGVTFSVDDADAIAARAAELGGSVLVPPTEAPWVRFTVIADPQGATFVASHFTPDTQTAAATEEASSSAA